MTSNASRLEPRRTADGSFSLFSSEFGEAFHSGLGALAEARSKFVAPAALDRWRAGATLRVLDVCVGTGCNTAALLEACQTRGLELSWWGLELDPEPLRLALADQGFCRQWQAGSTDQLAELCGSERMLWGDARSRLSELLESQRGQLDLVLMDAFSPSRCPQLWTLEFLGALAALLQPQGRLLTYCSAAAIRNALRQAGLQLASIAAPSGLLKQTSDWSGGTAASPGRLDGDPQLRPLSAMEEEHLLTNAAEPYRDPSGDAERAEILRQRQQAQARAMAIGTVEGTGAWRRRWGVGTSRHQ
jgi:tRNA U34 5-methylaminomethyl-2-thiouridine-forming methyltransferase MnmC